MSNSVTLRALCHIEHERAANKIKARSVVKANSVVPIVSSFPIRLGGGNDFLKFRTFGQINKTVIGFPNYIGTKCGQVSSAIMNDILETQLCCPHLLVDILELEAEDNLPLRSEM